MTAEIGLFFTLILFWSSSSIPVAQGQTTIDLLIKNGIVLTVNAADTIHHDGFVAINEGIIVDVGPMTKAAKYRPKDTIDADGDIVMPGLINGHTHASMTVFRSLADDVPDRLHKYVFPLESKVLSREMVRVGAQLANLEMIQGGVTTYTDMYYYEDVVAETVEEAGMRAILGETIIGFPVAYAKTPEDSIAYALDFIERYKDHPLITPAFAPHAPYTNSTETLQEITRLSDKMDVPILIHLAESDREKKAILERANLSPVQYMDSINALNDKTIAAHVVIADDRDIAILKRRGVGVSHNLSSNLKSGKGIAPAMAMYDAGVRIGLGTDGPMSGNSLSTLDELDIVSKVHKVDSSDVLATTPKKIIRMSTIGGAEALHMEDEIGSLEPEKFADVIVIDAKSANMTPIYNPYSSVVYCANAGNVKHSVINGVIVMRDRKVLTLDEDRVIADANSFKRTVIEVLNEMGAAVE